MRWPVWTPDSRDILYAVTGAEMGLPGIYRVHASGGQPLRVAGVGDYAQAVAIASKGHRLAYSRRLLDRNIWRMALPAAGSSAGTATKFLASTRQETGPSYSPDGKRIAFSSDRSGVWQLWLADADGSNPVALTDFPTGLVGGGGPRWSPDGQTIVFDARPHGSRDVYTIKPNGGVAQRLTDHRAEDQGPRYSADGRWIYFVSNRSGERQMYRMPAGGGEAMQITHKGAYYLLASPDGKWIYYKKLGGGLWKVPAEGGEETQLLPQSSLYNHPPTFDVTASGIYFGGERDMKSGKVPLRLYRFQDRKIVDLGYFDKPPQFHISVSPDEKWLLYTQIDSAVDDLMLVENFR